MAELSGIHQRTEELLQLWDATVQRIVIAVDFQPIGKRVANLSWAVRPLLGIFLVNLVKAKRRYFKESEEL